MSGRRANAAQHALAINCAKLRAAGKTNRGIALQLDCRIERVPGLVKLGERLLSVAELR